MAKSVIDDKARIENMLTNIDYCIKKINSVIKKSVRNYFSKNEINYEKR